MSQDKTENKTDNKVEKKSEKFSIKNKTNSDIELRVKEKLFTFPVGILDLSNEENKQDIIEAIEKSVYKNKLVIIRGNK